MDMALVKEELKKYGITNEKELDAALKKSTFSLGVMAAGSMAGNDTATKRRDRKSTRLNSSHRT